MPHHSTILLITFTVFYSICNPPLTRHTSLVVYSYITVAFIVYVNLQLFKAFSYSQKLTFHQAPWPIMASFLQKLKFLSSLFWLHICKQYENTVCLVWAFWLIMAPLGPLACLLAASPGLQGQRNYFLLRPSGLDSEYICIFFLKNAPCEL